MVPDEAIGDGDEAAAPGNMDEDEAAALNGFLIDDGGIAAAQFQAQAQNIDINSPAAAIGQEVGADGRCSRSPRKSFEWIFWYGSRDCG